MSFLCHVVTYALPTTIFFDSLTSVLLFHVLAGDVKVADLTDSYVTSLSTGPNDEQVVLQIDVTGGIAFNGG